MVQTKLILTLIVIVSMISSQELPKGKKKKKAIRCGSKTLSNVTSCYNQETNEDLLLIGAGNITEDSIFFVETSCGGGLNYRQACSVESAARAHKNKNVNVLFAGPVNRHCLKRKPMAALLMYDNVHFYRVNLRKFSRGTPLKKLIRSGAVSRSANPIHHMSEILRYLVLNKFGGIYLDLDVMVLKSFDSLPQKRNWAGMEDALQVGSAVMALSKLGHGNQVAQAAIEILKDNFTPSWVYERQSNSNVLAKALNQVCTDSNCDFTVYEPYYFYPVPIDNHNDYFMPETLNLSRSYAAHIWNSKTHNIKITDHSNFAKLAKALCPLVNKMNNKAYKFTDIQRTKVEKLYDTIVINMKNRKAKLRGNSSTGRRRKQKCRDHNVTKYHRVRSAVKTFKPSSFRFFDNLDATFASTEMYINEGT